AASLLRTPARSLGPGPPSSVRPPLGRLASLARRGRARPALGVSLVAAVVLAFTLPFVNKPGDRLVWSPYYRINLVPGTPETSDVRNGNALGWSVLVNHDYFQRGVDLRPAAIAAAPKLAPVARN